MEAFLLFFWPNIHRKFVFCYISSLNCSFHQIDCVFVYNNLPLVVKL